jgi:hypothetical protein
VRKKLSTYVAALDALKNNDRLRSLKRVGIDFDFSSNDYLGLASAPRMRRAIVAAVEASTPIGAAGSRLLRGNCAEHENREAEAAKFFGAEGVCATASSKSSETNLSGNADKMLEGFGLDIGQCSKACEIENLSQNRSPTNCSGCEAPISEEILAILDIYHCQAQTS